MWEWIGIASGVLGIFAIIIGVTNYFFRMQHRIGQLEKCINDFREQYKNLEQEHKILVRDLTKKIPGDYILSTSMQVEIPETKEKVGTGWLRSLPDPYDYVETHPDIQGMLSKVGIPQTTNAKESLPSSVDLRAWCPEIKNQGGLNSSTAHAAVALFDYFNRRAYGRTIDGSRLYVYKNARNLMNSPFDTGADIRNTLAAIILFGIPPEEHWSYTDNRPDFDEDPPSFIYAMAENYWTVRYFCHDPSNEEITPDTILTRVKTFLAAGIPSIFGFYGFSSFFQSNVKGGIPYPCRREKPSWGQAVFASGYDDKIQIQNLKCKRKTKGAILIRNSWGDTWGQAGYGWLPYEYILSKLAFDFWSILNFEWVDTKQFGL